MASAWSQLDQLLTCAICLDRYRNPKLLPCQHTFCMEPCLDGLIDYARRQIKCPECRAEHRIPYQGIQQFPTNVTLMRFLELHRDITGEEPEPPPSLMERCSVCSEKSNVERCAHCEKKICPDCKEAHVDILRREINRINNQVRRGLHRLSEALTQTKKNAEKLQLNCKQVKDEIDDIVRRYSKDLKVTEEKLKRDLEMYTQSEMKSIDKLKEDLEVEVNNISSNCELVDKYIQDDCEWSDVELLEYKQVFLKMLDFLRTFDIENTDFTRRIKFQPRADPDVLHRNIADFGELKINSPMNQMPTQQSLMTITNSNLMRSQSDHRLADQFARRSDNRSFSDLNQKMDSDRSTSPLHGRRRYTERSRDYDHQDGRLSNRYSDTGYGSSRWRDDDYSHRNRHSFEDSDPEPHGRTVRFADEPHQQAKQRAERIFDVDDSTKGPLSGVVKLLDLPKIMERLHQNEVKQKQHQQSSSTEDIPTPPVVIPNRPTPQRQPSEVDVEPPPPPVTVAEEASSSLEIKSPVPETNTEESRHSRQPLVKTPSVDGGEPLRRPSDKKVSARPWTPVYQPEEDSDEESEEEEESYARDAEPTASQPVTSSTTRQRRLPEPEPRLLEMHQSESEEELDEDEEESEEEEVTNVIIPSTRNDPHSEEESDDGDSKDSSVVSSSDSESAAEKTLPQTPSSNSTKIFQPEQKHKKDSGTSQSQSSEEDSENELDANEKITSGEEVNTEDEETFETPRRSLPSYESVANKNRFRKRTDLVPSTTDDVRKRLLRSKSSHELGLNEEDEDSVPAYRTRTQRTQEPEVPSTNHNNSWAKYLTNKYGRASASVPRSRSSHSLYHQGDEDSQSEEEDPVFASPRSNYMQKRRLLLQIGSRGSDQGQFNWPRGVAVGPGDSVAVADSGNRRIQVFDGRGSFSFSFGSGSGDEVAGVSVNRIGQFIVSSPHHVRLFDPTGRFLREFGCEGRTDGRFSCPWGLTTDSLGFIYVCDTDNHRIQVFQSDGSFVGKFGVRGLRPGQLDQPHYIAVTHHTNKVVVSDTHNHRVQVFDVNGRSLTSFGTEGTAEGYFRYPRGIAVDDQGYILVADSGNHRVQVFQPDGTFLRSFGGSAWGFRGLEGLAVTSEGKILVCDRDNHRIQVF